MALDQDRRTDAAAHTASSVARAVGSPRSEAIDGAVPIEPPPNTLLTEARKRLSSPTGSGRPISRQELAEAVNAYLWKTYRMGSRLDEKDIGKLERGRNRWPRERRREAFRAVLRVQTDAEIGFYVIRGTITSSDVMTRTPAPTAIHLGRGHRLGLRQVETVRQGLTDTLREGSMAEASLDDWDLTALRHGRATRDRPAGMVLDDLTADLAELGRTIHRHRSASALRRLTRVAAQMSGLMCLTLCKLDQRSAFRQWARSARLAADEAGDPETQSWTLAQEAYGYFYSNDLAEAVDVAQQAQAVAAATPCVGAALAAALEARAYAAMGLGQETRSALGRAETNLSSLEGDALASSAFGYNEAQFRFHEGNAYTHLGDVPSALAAQDRALELCAPGDYTDWAMTHLDRTSCLSKTGDTSDALRYATTAISALSDAQRWGIITLRGHEILDSLPRDRQELAAVRDFRELLMQTTERKEATRP